MRPFIESASDLTGYERLVTARLLAEAGRELRRLALVRGASRRTWRRRAQVAAMAMAAAGLLGMPGLAPRAQALPPVFAGPIDLPDVGELSTPAFPDLDGDGDLDALIGNSDGDLLFFENTGTAMVPVFAAPQTNPFGLGPVVGLANAEMADLDDDGDLDALVGDTNGAAVFFANTGTASAPAFAPAQTNPFGLVSVAFASHPALTDLDDDGDLDALIGGADGNSIFYENTGTATTPAFAAPMVNPFGLTNVGPIGSGPELADIDGDGDIDAQIGQFYGNIIFFENTGTATVPAFAAPQTNPFGLADVGSDSRPGLADIDGDGDLDAFIGNEDGLTTFFRNAGSASAPQFTSHTNPFGLAGVADFAHLALADIDDDGDLDALIGENDGNTSFFENTGTTAVPAFAAALVNPFGLTDVGYGSRPALADLDGDGDLDALIGENGGTMLFFENTGTAVLPAFAAPQTNPFGFTDVGNAGSPVLADIDRDGDLDALIGDIEGDHHFFENTGTAVAPAFATAQINPFGLTDVGLAASPALVDVDRDGDLDALVGESNGNLLLFRNTGNATQPAFAPAQTNPFGLADVGGVSTPELGDLDGDGSLDALIGEVAGDVIFFDNLAPACTPAALSGCDVPAKSLLLVKDSNVDTKDQVKLKLTGGTPAREGSAFGDPTTTDTHLLCLYDDGVLIAQSAVLPDAVDWQPIGTKGFAYYDASLARDGTRKIVLTAGAANSPKPTKVLWLGKGALLPDPTVPVSEPVNVTAQVVGSNGLCLSETFTSAIKNAANGSNTLRTFKAKKP